MKICKICLLFSILLFMGCTKPGELGTKSNPIKMYFVPSLEAGKIVTSGQAVADHLTEATGYHFKVAVPTSYAAVIEAMGTKETDIAWLATFAYILANEKYGAEVALTTVRNGLTKYKGQFLARRDSDIDSMQDIDGKIIAYTDASSTSGHVYPSVILKAKNIKPKNYIFAGGHSQAILAVYDGTADVACTFWSPAAENGEIRDARRTIFDTHPDVVEKIKIVDFTDWIPNDTVTFRKDFPEEMKTEIVESLLHFANTEEGHQTLLELLDIDNFVRAQDSDYDSVRKTLKEFGKEAGQVLE